LFIVQKHFAQTCGSITLATLHTFHQNVSFLMVKHTIYKHEYMTA